MYKEADHVPRTRSRKKRTRCILGSYTHAYSSSSYKTRGTRLADDSKLITLRILIKGPGADFLLHLLSPQIYRKKKKGQTARDPNPQKSLPAFCIISLFSTRQISKEKKTSCPRDSLGLAHAKNKFEKIEYETKKLSLGLLEY